MYKIYILNKHIILSDFVYTHLLVYSTPIPTPSMV